MSSEWDDFLNFLRDMGERPSRSHSIDRIDNNGPYAPGNCRWATQVEQSANRRTNRLLTHCGRTQTVTDWARELHMSEQMIFGRLYWGWDVERTLTAPARDNARLLTHDGRTLPLTAWSRNTGIDRNTIATRLRAGWPIDRALTTPVQ